MYNIFPRRAKFTWYFSAVLTYLPHFRPYIFILWNNRVKQNLYHKKNHFSLHCWKSIPAGQGARALALRDGRGGRRAAGVGHARPASDTRGRGHRGDSGQRNQAPVPHASAARRQWGQVNQNWEPFFLHSFFLVGVCSPFLSTSIANNSVVSFFSLTFSLRLFRSPQVA